MLKCENHGARDCKPVISGPNAFTDAFCWALVISWRRVAAALRSGRALLRGSSPHLATPSRVTPAGLTHVAAQPLSTSTFAAGLQVRGRCGSVFQRVSSSASADPERQLRH